MSYIVHLPTKNEKAIKKEIKNFSLQKTNAPRHYHLEKKQKKCMVSCQLAILPTTDEKMYCSIQATQFHLLQGE